MDRETENWLNAAEYDLRAARDMLDARHYLHVVFLCHLAVEKALKGGVRRATGKTPPKTHDLVALLRLSGFTLPQELLDFVGRLGGASVATRYPDDLSEALQLYTGEVAAQYLQHAEEVTRWIRQRLRH